MIQKLSLYDPDIREIKENSFIECYCVVEDWAHDHEYITTSSDLFLDIKSAENKFNEILNSKDTKDLISELKEQAYKNNSALITREEKNSKEYYIKEQYDTERYSIHIQGLYQRLTKKEVYDIHEQVELETFANAIETFSEIKIDAKKLKTLYDEFQELLDEDESYNTIYMTTLFQVLKDNNLLPDDYNEI